MATLTRLGAVVAGTEKVVRRTVTRRHPPPDPEPWAEDWGSSPATTFALLSSSPENVSLDQQLLFRWDSVKEDGFFLRQSTFPVASHGGGG